MSDLHILVVEDEAAIREMLVMALGLADFKVLAVASADHAQLALEENFFDLIILDWMLPGISGIEMTQHLKNDTAYKDIPIILLTVRSEEEDKILGLESGADDYVTKPFSPKELIARIKAVVRRSSKLSDASPRLQFGDLTLDAEQHRLAIAGLCLAVSPTEFRLMQFFMNNPDKVYSRSYLLDQVWGRSIFIDERTVDVHILRLRKILAEHGKEKLIQTVRGYGYRFVV